MEKFRKKFEFIGKIDSFDEENNDILFKTTNRSVKISILSDKMFRIRMSGSQEFENDFSWAVLKREWSKINFKIEDQENFIIISTNELELNIHVWHINLVSLFFFFFFSLLM